jgi:hypothetical protein
MRQPLHRLTGHAGDRVEMTVVMKERCAVHLGHRCDQDVERCRASMLAPLREGRLNTRGGAFATVVKR